MLKGVTKDGVRGSQRAHSGKAEGATVARGPQTLGRSEGWRMMHNHSFKARVRGGQAGSVHGRPSRPSLEPMESSGHSPRTVGKWSPEDDDEQRAQCLTQGGCLELLHFGVGNRDQSGTGGGPGALPPIQAASKED